MPDSMSDIKNEFHDVSPHHSNLLKNIEKLDKNILRIQKPLRSEPTLEISEFQLGKNVTSDGDVIKTTDLIKTLSEKTHGSRLNIPLNKNKRLNVVPKPLAKAVGDKLKREIHFENVQTELNKWDNIVTKNRISTNMQFPLKQQSVSINPTTIVYDRIRVKSALEDELEALEPAKKDESDHTVDQFSLTLEEVLMKNRELAKFRAQQSYKDAKAYRQKKIKSKKYHNIKKKEKIKQQHKEFENLQKINPEAALEKLEQIDKIRAKERMSLKHKNTGMWAKNKEHRAKYDKESRQALAQQLSIGRELTKKINPDTNDDDDEDEENNKELPKIDDSLQSNDNPWLAEEREMTLEEFTHNYRKYWNDKHNLPQIENTNHNANLRSSKNNLNNTSSHPIVEAVVCSNDMDTNSEGVLSENELKHKDKKLIHKNSKVISKKSKNIDDICNYETTVNVMNVGTTKWSVHSIDDKTRDKLQAIRNVPSGQVIDRLFDNASMGIDKKKNKSKIKRMKSKSKKILLKTANSSINEKNSEDNVDLDEVITKENYTPPLNGSLSTSKSNNLQFCSSNVKSIEIDPKCYLKTKSKFVNTQLPDDEVNNDDDEDLKHENSEEMSQYNVISEAFADDNVMDEFAQQKQNEIEKSKIGNLDITLPGWGCWGGINIKISKRKKQRFIIKHPEISKRKDENKDNVIIIDDDESKIKKHQVSDIPHPFNNTADFEASIRMPYGRNFIPENSHRRLVQPSVRTKIGKIIDPMDHNSIIQKKKDITILK